MPILLRCGIDLPRNALLGRFLPRLKAAYMAASFFYALAGAKFGRPSDCLDAAREDSAALRYRIAALLE
jgi:hypothetical protein